MSTFVYYLLLLTFISLALCQDQCDEKYQDMNSTDINLKEYCNDIGKPCIIKCCGGNDQIFYNFIDTVPYGLACNSTDLYKVDINKWNGSDTIYKKEIKTNIEKASNSMSDYKFLLDMDIECKNMYTDYSGMNSYLLENGALMLEWPNHYKRWFEYPQYSFCFDYVIDIENDMAVGEPYIGFGIFTANAPEMKEPSYEPLKKRMLYTAIGLLISSFFLILVLLVYAILPDLHSLAGLVLMASVGTQTCAFLIIGIDYIKVWHETLDDEFCETFRYPRYYFLLSTICWVTIQSFEAWRVITSKKFTIFKSDKPSREKILKICMYGLFAWGIPVLMTIMVKVVHEMDLTSMPWFIKPHIDMTCYFGDRHSLMLYQDLPMLILLGFNMIFYILSAKHIWKLSKWKRKNNMKKRIRFWFYVKLSLIMGLNWLLYVIVGFLPPEMKWFAYIFETYVLFSGAAIFFFFVVQRRVFKLLKKRVFCRRSSSSRSEEDDRSSKKTECVENDNMTCNEMTTINIAE